MPASPAKERRYWFPKPFADLVARLRVPSGFLLVIAFGWLARPDAISLSLGVPIAALGLFLRAWAAGHLAKNQRLAQDGPYALMRNPLYVGTLLVAVGLVVAAAEWRLAVLFGLVFAFVYLPVIELEEQHLRKLFPEYESYAQRVPVLFPRFPVAPSSDGAQRFSWKQYWKNEEYQALIGFLAGLLYLAYKASLIGSSR
jgi:protein-S-isoprenylcysteine O-methyltransferase Ste14